MVWNTGRVGSIFYVLCLVIDQFFTTDENKQQPPEVEQQPPEAPDDEVDISYPVECSSDTDSLVLEPLNTINNEFWYLPLTTKDFQFPLTCSSDSNGQQEIFMLADRLVDHYCSEADRPQEVETPVDKLSIQKTSPPIIEEKLPPNVQKIHQDDCDDSESDEEESSTAIPTDGLNYCEENEKYVPGWAVLDPNTKSDHGNESEVQAAKSPTMIQNNDGSLVPCNASAGKGNQEHAMDLQAASIKLPNPICKQTTIQDQVQQQDHNYFEIFPGYNTPND